MKIGDKVKLLKDIWEDGDDHHPSGYIAKEGEILIVRNVVEPESTSHFPIYISHEYITNKSFGVMPDEIEQIEESKDSTI